MDKHQDIITDGLVIMLNTIIRTVHFMEEYPNDITLDDLKELELLVSECKKYVKE